MNNIEQKINDLLVAGQGVLVRRDHRAIGAQLDYALRRGLLRSTLPGVYTAAPPSLEAQIRAAALFRPNAVITGAAAAKVLATAAELDASSPKALMALAVIVAASAR